MFGVPIGIGTTSSTIAVKICVITAGNKKCKSITLKKEKKHDKIVLLAKSNLISIEILVSKVLINSVINHDEFILINNAQEDNK